LFKASGRTLVARFVGGGSVDVCRVARWGSRAPCRALTSRSFSSHSPQRRSRSLPVASLFGWAHARRSQSRDSRGIVGLVSMSNAASLGKGGRSRSRARRARRSLGRRFLPSSVSCCAIALRVRVCVCSALAGARIFGGRRLRRAPPRLSGCRMGGRRACICARVLAMLVRGGACYRRSSVVRVAARAIARACACASLASARVFGRRRSCHTERAPPHLLWGGLHVHARRCGPLVASRPPGDLKNTTNTHPISLARTPVSFELRGPGFLAWLYFFRAGGQSTNELPQTETANRLLSSCSIRG
jgi:hypothetical protein